jgi:methylthioribose-1-phosphate isomerase
MQKLSEIGGKIIAAEKIKVLNPAFDFAPANLIKAIFTEKGVFKPSQIKNQIN